MSFGTNVSFGIALFLILSVGIVGSFTSVDAESPRKQMKRGVSVEDISCKDGFSLMIRNNGSPACVSEETADRLEKRGLGKIEEGIIIKINPNKIPRIIGREGSMIKMIKDETGCEITAGQNGLIWIKGNKIEDELFAKRAILFVTEKSFVSGLTDEVKEWFEKQKKK